MRAIAVTGPSGSGKTTLVEAMASLEGSRSQSLKLMGDIGVTMFEYMEDKWAVLDIPGGHDNLSQIGSVLAASDAAVLCVPAETDAAVLAAPYLRILEETGMPVFIFINKIDVAADRVSDIVSALQRYCRHGIVLRQVPMRSDNEIVGAIDLISERAWEYREGERSTLVEVPEKMFNREQEARTELLESLADFDDNLLEQIIEDQSLLTEDVYEVATRVLQRHDLVLSFLGAASHGNGIQRLMKSLRHEAPQVEALRERLNLPDDILAVSCSADHLKHVGKAILIRALGDGVQSSIRLGGGMIGSLNAIDVKTPVSSLAPGKFALIIKSDHVAPGNFYTSNKTIDLPEWTEAHPAALRRLVEPVHEKDDNKLSTALARLAEIDPGLTLAQDETSGLLEIGVQGPLHLRRTVEKLAEAYGIEVECSDVPTAFRETIRKGVEKRYRHRKQSGGAGQFADVVVAIAPGVRGSGFEFGDTVKGGAVPRNYIPSVEAGAREALTSGPSGYPVVDLRVTLLDGKTHSVDSSDYAFQMAGQSATREALSEIGTFVLQPILKLEVHVPSIFAGSLAQLASGLTGQVLGFEAHPTATGWDVFRTLLPMASHEEFSRALGSATRGTAWFESNLDHYEQTREYAAADA
ncbi:elongation factor G [Roseovarius aestuarii]|uniref:Elongation factor G n=1 Tax=Roseovarius aestuarii TaxID=475083 RepID=A0A1X7BWT8_9RHOB|nr:elongation factor G [Roseovarius aestuarii]SMC14108.1 Elongation factor G [Roseovarius aestuarii]